MQFCFIQLRLDGGEGEGKNRINYNEREGSGLSSEWPYTYNITALFSHSVHFLRFSSEMKGTIK